MNERDANLRRASELECEAEKLKTEARKLRDRRYVGDRVEIGDKLGSHGSSRHVYHGVVVAVDNDMYKVKLVDSVVDVCEADLYWY